MTHPRHLSWLVCAALLLPAAPAAAQDGKAPPELVARWTEAFNVMQALNERGKYFIYQMSGPSFEVPGGESLEEKLGEYAKLEQDLIPKAKQLIAAMEANWGPNDRQWDDAISKKYGVQQRIRGTLMMVVDPGQRPDGKGPLQPAYYHRQLSEYVKKLEGWKERILRNHQESLEATVGGEGRDARSLGEMKKVGGEEYLPEEGVYRRVKFFLENHMPTAQVLAKHFPDRFGAYPQKLEQRAEEMGKQIDAIVDAYELPEGLSEDQWGSGDYDEVLTAAYEYFPEALHVRLSEAWEVNERNLIGEPMQHHVEVYAVKPFDKDKNLAKVIWTDLFTKQERNSKPEPPFAESGGTQTYLMRLDRVPASTKPGGFFATLFKLILFGGCCLGGLGAIGGLGFFVMKQQKAAAATATATAPPAGSGPVGPEVPPPSPEGTPPA